MEPVAEASLSYHAPDPGTRHGANTTRLGWEGGMTFDRLRRVRINLAVPALCLLTLVLWTAPILAATRTYGIDTEGSLVQFAWDFGKTEVLGRMPVSRADLSIDFQELGHSRVTVALDASNAETGFAFATQAMRGSRMLDIRQFPLITFVSTRVTRTAPSLAEIDGNITIRNVTRPTHLRAEIYRQRGSDQADLSSLTILLTGAVERSAFGASGWSDMVGNEVRLRILARIHQVD